MSLTGGKDPAALVAAGLFSLIRRDNKLKTPINGSSEWFQSRRDLNRTEPPMSPASAAADYREIIASRRATSHELG